MNQKTSPFSDFAFNEKYLRVRKYPVELFIASLRVPLHTSLPVFVLRRLLRYRS